MVVKHIHSCFAYGEYEHGGVPLDNLNLMNVWFGGRLVSATPLLKILEAAPDESLKCDHSTESLNSYRSVLSPWSVYYDVQGVSYFRVCGSEC